VAAPGLRGGRRLVVPPGALGHDFSVDVASRMIDHEVAVGRDGVKELRHDRVRLLRTRDQVQDSHHEDRDWLAEVE
jgi:hypothetical protein